MSQYKLLVVDDDERIRSYIENVGREMGYETRALEGPDNLGTTLQEFEPHAVLLDLVMPGTDGVEILKRLAMRNCAVPILLMSGMDGRTLGAAGRLGREHGLRRIPPFAEQLGLQRGTERFLEADLDATDAGEQPCDSQECLLQLLREP